MASRLPNEILYAIAELLEENDLISLAQSDSRFLSVCNPVLYRKNMLESDGWALIWAIINRQPHTVACALSTGVTELGEALAFAVEDGQEQVVEGLLSVKSADFSPKYDFYGQFLNWTSQDRITSKCTAASSRCIEQLKARHQWNRHGGIDNRSPLSRAARGGHLRIVKLLIELYGGDLNVEDLYGQTPLFHAVQGGFLDIAKVLFSTGHYNMNVTDSNFRTVLSHAARLGQSEMVQWLVSCGAAINLNHQDRYGQTPLHYAVERSDMLTAKVLIETGRVDQRIANRNGETPLDLATQHSDASIVNLLVESSRVDLDFGNNNGYALLYVDTSLTYESTPSLSVCSEMENKDLRALHGATEHSNTSQLEHLIELRELDPNISEEQGQWMFLEAIRNSDTSTLKLLVCSDKVDLDRADDQGRTPLSHAAQYSDISIMKLLIDTGRVNLDSRDSNGRTPLSYAAQHADTSAVKLLVDSGEVEVDSKDIRGRTPLSYAAQHMDLVNLATLVRLWYDDDNESGPNPNNLVPRRSLGDTSTLRALINCGKADPNSRDGKGRTPLSYAAEYSDSAAIKLLLGSPLVQIESKDNEGRTPFFEAIAWGNLSAAELLLNSPMVDPNPRDNYGDTPIFELFDLYHTLSFQDEDQIFEPTIKSIVVTGYNRIVKLLLESCDVKLDSQDHYGQTLLSYAAENCGYDVVRLLIDSGKFDPIGLDG
ncbi:ankyrin repeat-containing protein [Aspergillus nomiae NRRL 13137]|uniref:Ankyrin repeat-containing protein n=1 Tax=Aspergillus nomiae NRRL (strain ATCC 15546 / NRRL 13137 / CBS 260.88 / M93) TaxID=1509407 RepID=A0A0L1J5R8_ASPN3|nr:ankyrin repeat-containing protein [Aspergillus nomiae NRRL 13137]KNG87082.1 ankyrin repeat-containing protein [Aspergillus nomiae NRRL 13137]